MEKFDGDIRIENAIWEALTKYRIPGEQMQCLLHIIRKTIGWNKTESIIQFTDFIEATGINKGNVGRALRGLIEKKVVVKKDTNRGVSYCFNKKYKTWKLVSKKTLSVKKDTKRCLKRQQSLSKKTPPPIIYNKQLKTKERINSDELKQSDKDITFSLNNGRPYKISKFLFKLIQKRDPKQKEPNWKEWATQIDRLNRIDKRDFTEIKKVIRWCQQDDFWQNNILSTAKLRKQFPQLRLKMLQKPKITSRDIGSQKRKNTVYSKPKIIK